MVETLLEVRNLSKTFRYRTGLFRRQTVEAVKTAQLYPARKTDAGDHRRERFREIHAGENAGRHGGTHCRRAAD